MHIYIYIYLFNKLFNININYPQHAYQIQVSPVPESLFWVPWTSIPKKEDLGQATEGASMGKTLRKPMDDSHAHTETKIYNDVLVININDQKNDSNTDFTLKAIYNSHVNPDWW